MGWQRAGFGGGRGVCAGPKTWSAGWISPRREGLPEGLGRRYTRSRQVRVVRDFSLNSQRDEPERVAGEALGEPAAQRAQGRRVEAPQPVCPNGLGVLTARPSEDPGRFVSVP